MLTWDTSYRAHEGRVCRVSYKVWNLINFPHESVQLNAIVCWTGNNWTSLIYRQTYKMTLLGNKIVYHSDVVWSIACRRCSNYIFILDLTPSFGGLGKVNCKTRCEAFKFWDLVPLISRNFTVYIYTQTFMAFISEYHFEIKLQLADWVSISVIFNTNSIEGG